MRFTGCLPLVVGGRRASLVLAACHPLLAPLSPAAEPLPLSPEFWRDPAFVRSFNGSYRIEARVEPTVSSAERGLLVEVQKRMAAGERKQALVRLAASELTENSAALRFNLANLRFEEGEVEQAVADYRAALELYPPFLRAHRNLAVALVRLGQPDQAVQHLLEALRLGDSDPLSWGLLGWCRLQHGKHASALDAYRMARAVDPDRPEWLAGIAECLQQLGEDAEAAALLEEVVRERPAEASYGLLRADLLLQLGRPAEAAAGLDFLRRLGVLDPDGQLLLGTLHLRGGRDRLAAEVIDSALAGDRLPSAERLLAALRETVDRGAWELARRLAGSAEAAVGEENPAAARQLIRLRARLAIESGADPAAGCRMLEGLLESDPLDGESLLVLGRQRSGDGRTGEAALLFERAARVDAIAPEAWVEIARLRVGQARYAEALEAVDRSLALREQPALQAYRQALAELVEADR